MRALFSEFLPDAVLHLAAEIHVDRSIDGPAAFIHTNIVGTFELLQAATAYWRGLGRTPASGSACCSLDGRGVRIARPQHTPFNELNRLLSRARRTPRAKPHPIIWCEPGTKSTHSPRSSRIARTTTGPIISRKS